MYDFWSLFIFTTTAILILNCILVWMINFIQYQCILKPVIEKYIKKEVDRRFALLSEMAMRAMTPMERERIISINPDNTPSIARAAI